MNIESLNYKINYKINLTKNEIRDRICQLYLLLLKGRQQKNFYELISQCLSYYNTLSISDESLFVTQAWIDYNKKMEQLIVPKPIFSFLRHPEILATMFLVDDGNFIKGELDYCEKFMNLNELRQLLEEDYVGTPIIRNYKYLTSHTRIHHLYHLIKFQEQTDISVNTFKQVIEWGGGYGDMARLMLRINPEVTYTIIDTSLFCCVQWLYLASIIGAEKVNLIDSYDGKIEKNKINIVPLAYINNIKIKADFFIATWSLSESSSYSIDYVRSHNFFEANNFLVAYQLSSDYFPHAEQLGSIVSGYGATIKECELLPDNYYAFK